MINYFDDEELNEDIVLSKDRTRAKRRKNSVKKAIRKRNLNRAIVNFYPFAIERNLLYDNLHQYSKNKIHCSCKYCRFKNVYEPDRKTASDMKKIDAQNLKIKEYERGDVA